ncbi:MAG: hypothetical protein MPJ22_00035 [Pirellulales bacterium]|nr:hypothetical protein [Pirellulales bacterium]
MAQDRQPGRDHPVVMPDLAVHGERIDRYGQVIPAVILIQVAELGGIVQMDFDPGMVGGGLAQTGFPFQDHRPG